MSNNKYDQFERMRILTLISYKDFILALIITVEMIPQNTIQCVLLPSLLSRNNWGILHEKNQVTSFDKTHLKLNLKLFKDTKGTLGYNITYLKNCV